MEWKSLAFLGFPHYEVSSRGDIKSTHRYTHNITLADTAYGYKQVMLHYKKQRKMFLVHRLVALAFIPNPNNLPDVHHKDENRHNNALGNLEWMTKAENTFISQAGESSIHAKLDWEIVRWIRASHIPRSASYSAAAIAKQLGLGKQAIHNIIYNRTWYDPEYVPNVVGGR